MQDYIPIQKDINEKLPTITVKQYDNLSRFLHIQIFDKDLPDLPDDEKYFNLENCTARLYTQPKDDDSGTNVAYIDGEVADSEKGIVTFLLPSSVTETAGNYEGEIWIYGAESSRPIISTKPFDFVVEKSIRNNTAIEGTSKFTALDNVLSSNDLMRAQIAALIASPAGSGGDVGTELRNIRIGYDGSTYESAGAAVRRQFSEVYKSLATVSRNIFTGTILPYANISNSTGEFSIHQSNVNTAAIENYIPVDGNEKYTASNVSENYADKKPAWFFYDSSKEFISANVNLESTCTTPENARYIRLKWRVTNSTEQLASELNDRVQVEKGETATSFVSHFFVNIPDNSVTHEKLVNDAVVSDKISDGAVMLSKLSFVIQSRNLRNFDSFTAFSNISGSTGVYSINSSNTNTVACDTFIPVEAGAQYTFSANINVNYRTQFFWYSSNNENSFLSWNDNGTNTMTAPQNANFLRIKISSANNTQSLSEATSIQIEKGNTSTEYVEPLIIPKEFLGTSEYDNYENNKKLIAIKTQLDLKRPLIAELNKDKKYINFGFCTDTHLSELDKTGLLDIEVLNQLAAENWLDFFVHGGDVFNSYLEGTSGDGIDLSTAIKRIDDAMSGFTNTKVPLYVARGNHDTNSKLTVSDKLTQPLFDMFCISQFSQNADNYNACSFFKDYEKYKVRVIMFDSYVTDTQSNVFTSESLGWLSNAFLLGNKHNYSVMLFAHTFEGSSRLAILTDLITAFKNGTTFSNSQYNVTIDFSEQGAGDFIGCICGHSHAETYTSDNGYWYITSGTSYLRKDINVADNIMAAVFTVDTDNKTLYKRKLGNKGQNMAFNWDTLEAIELS